MKSEEILTFANAKWNLTINWMVDIVNTFYPLSDQEKESLNNNLSKVIGNFINACENKEDDEQ